MHDSTYLSMKVYHGVTLKSNSLLEHVLLERLPDELVLVLDHLSFHVLWPAPLHVVHTDDRWNDAKLKSEERN